MHKAEVCGSQLLSGEHKDAVLLVEHQTRQASLRYLNLQTKLQPMHNQKDSRGTAAAADMYSTQATHGAASEHMLHQQPAQQLHHGIDRMVCKQQ
jgi:hypothetical protein